MLKDTTFWWGVGAGVAAVWVYRRWVKPLAHRKAGMNGA